MIPILFNYSSLDMRIQVKNFFYITARILKGNSGGGKKEKNKVKKSKPGSALFYLFYLLFQFWSCDLFEGFTYIPDANRIKVLPHNGKL